MDTTINVEAESLVCVRTNDGEFKTNFPQKVWFDPEVSMGCSEEGQASLTTRTLAVNILQTLFPQQEILLAIGKCSRSALALHRPFADEVLATMPEEGGNLPLEVLLAWVKRNALVDFKTPDLPFEVAS